MKVYLLPGLGFDNRIFERLDLGNDMNLDYLNWMEPAVNETIKDYAVRFSKRIKEDGEEIILIGHSFGGIMAQEIAAIRPVEKVILISSIKSQAELPFSFKIIKPLYIHKLFSKGLTIKTIKFWGQTHGYQTAEEQRLVKEMVNSYSNHTLQWSLKQLSIWKKPAIKSSTHLFQIHGEFDKTFPLKLIQQPNKIIKDASHFLVYKKAELISEIIKVELNTGKGNL